jgi:hypothetical protein
MRLVSRSASCAVIRATEYYEYSLLWMPIESRYGLDNRVKSKTQEQLERREMVPEIELEEFEKEMKKGGKTNRIFIESRGYIGVATYSIRTVDVVCQFQGSDAVAICGGKRIEPASQMLAVLSFQKEK